MKIALVLTSIEVLCGLCLASHYGVVVGVADYPGTANDLSYPDDDAAAVYERLLTDETLWAPDRLVLLLNEEATEEGLFAAISAFSEEAGPEDTLVLYFSGHGTRAVDTDPLDEADGYDEYLCTYGSTLSEFLSDDELSAALAGTPFGKVIVIIDACFSGGELRAPGREVKSLWAGLGEDEFMDDLLRLKLKTMDLDNLVDKEVVGLAAADDSQYAWEYGPPLEHGLFTYFLLEALEGWADGLTSLDGAISGEEAFNYLLPRVLAVSETDGLNQTPQLLDIGTEELSLLWVADNCFSTAQQLEAAGWYMVSFPGVPCGSDDPGQQLGDDLVPAILFRFDPKLGSYRMYPGDPQVLIRGGWGYWLRAYEPPVQLDAEVWLPGGAARVLLEPGWNQIGNPFPFEVALSQLQVRRGWETIPVEEAQLRQWVSAYLFGYETENRSYVMLDPATSALEPWHGYWMRAYVKCELIVPAQPAPPTPPGHTVFELELQGIGSPPSPPLSASTAKDIQVMVAPNPLRGEGEILFAVSGICPCRIQAMRVEVYDLTGRLVWAGMRDAAWLTWDGHGRDGNPLANGVFLYKIHLKINNDWVPVGVGKLAILR